jgi:Zn-dependent protease with chaperone function
MGKVLEIPFFMLMIFILSKPRFKGVITVPAAVSVTVLYMLASYFTIIGWHQVIYAYPLLDLTYSVASILLMALAALCLTRQRWVQNLFTMASAYVIITVVGSLSAIGYFILGWQPITSQILLYAALLPLIYLARRPITSILAQTKKGWWLLCSVPLFMIGCFLLISAVPVTLAQNPARVSAVLIFCGTTLVIYITFFYMMWQFHKQSLLEQNIITLRLSVADLEHQNEIIQQNERKYALFRHDVRHISQMLSACLSQNDMAGALQWLKPLSDDTAADGFASPIRSFTGHTLPDAVLCRYIEQAKIAGIDIQVRINMGRLLADATELAVVLANALENAVQACKRITDDKNPRAIRVDGQQRGAQFFLEIANTYTGDVYINPDTGLPSGPMADDGKEHGLGSQSIAFFAEKHGAALQYQIEGGWFRLRLLV